MNNQISSFLIGTVGLWVAFGSALVLTCRRSRPAPGDIGRIRWLTRLATGVHLLHLLEETALHFYVRFPGLLGIEPWSQELFLGFNLAWVVIWILSSQVLARHQWVLVFIWFLSLASALNMLAHPLLSLIVGGYFPGLWTSPIVGIAGVLLLRTLSQATSKRRQ